MKSRKPHYYVTRCDGQPLMGDWQVTQDTITGAPVLFRGAYASCRKFVLARERKERAERVSGRKAAREVEMQEVDRSEYCNDCRKYHLPPVWPVPCHGSVTA